MTKGIITVATPKYLESAKLLALTASKFSNLPTTLITTEPITADEFDKIVVAPGDVTNAFAVGLLSSPYKHTAFIYADSLVLSDITEYFTLLDKVDLVTPDAYDFKGQKLDSQLFIERKIITKNSLPDVWTNFFLYRTEAIKELSNTTSDIIAVWADVLKMSCQEYSVDTELKNKINSAFAISLKACGLNNNAHAVKFTNLSRQTNNTMLKHLADKDWYQLLSFWATDDNLVKIENYIQTGVVHYGSSWLNESRSNSIKQICN